MKTKILLQILLLPLFIFSQQVSFTEFDLDNGLHVIMHQDNSAPVVITSVMYDVGVKIELKVELDLRTSLNIYYLKVQKILVVENL